MQNNKIDFWFKIATVLSFLLLGISNYRNLSLIILQIILSVSILLICFIMIYINIKPDFYVTISKTKDNKIIFIINNNSQHKLKLLKIVIHKLKTNDTEIGHKETTINKMIPPYLDAETTIQDLDPMKDLKNKNILNCAEIILFIETEDGLPLFRIRKLNKKEIKILQQND